MSGVCRAQWALAGGNFSCLALQTKNNSTCQMTNRSPLYLSGAGVRREWVRERKNGTPILEVPAPHTTLWKCDPGHQCNFCHIERTAAFAGKFRTPFVQT